MATVTGSVTTVSNVLQGLKTAVNGFIQEEMKTKQDDSINRAIDVGLAIENANYAWGYHGALSQEADKAETAVKDLLADLKGIVRDLHAKQAATAINLQSRAQQFINSLPLTSWHPKLTATCPRYVFIQEGSCQIGFTGAFRYVANKGGAYSLILKHPLPLVADPVNSEVNVAGAGDAHKQDGEASLATKAEAPPSPVLSTASKASIVLSDMRALPIKATEKNLFFQLTGLGAQPVGDRYQYFQATLEVEYGGMLTGTKKAIYDIWLAAFPLRPGIITLKYPKDAATTVATQHFKSMRMGLFRKDFGPNTLAQREVTIKPSGPEWKISSRPKLVCNSVTTDIEEGQWGPDFVHVKLALPTDAHEMQAQVEFEEGKEVIEKKEFIEEIHLKWGETFTFEAPMGFTATLKAFDGQQVEVNGPDESKPYLHVKKITKSDGKEGYQLMAVVPSTK